MAVHFHCEDPQGLLAAFNDRITQTEAKEKITTWQLHTDGIHYTHRAADWTRKAWFKARVSADTLTFHIVRTQDQNVTTIAYAYYHGHLIETFLAHFDHMFSSAQATALPVTGDVV